MFSIKVSSLAIALNILSTSILLDQVSAMPMVDTINQRQETGGGYPTPTNTDKTTYDLSNWQEVDGVSFNDPVSVTAPGSISHSESYTVGYSITVGGGLNLDVSKILSLGATASISLSTSKGSTDTASYDCPVVANTNDDQWTCSLSITPSMIAKSGTQTTTGYHVETETNPYTVQFPRIADDKNLVFSAELCSCRNKEGWGSPGAPPPCPQDC